MGYIGLPTAVVLAENGWQVTGVDINPRIVDSINKGVLPFVEAELGGHLAKVVADGALRAQTEPPKADVYIIAVPTPFREGHEADLSYIFAAVESIAPMLDPGCMLILESTSPVGTTEKMLRRALELRPDLAGDGTVEGALICAAHAPERVLPGQIMAEMVANDRIVGGLTPRATDRAAAVYASFCEGRILRTDAQTAELAKLTENAFRDVNIAFANELSLICDGYGINVRELISLANKHPRVDILQPGPGVGGHCIAVDPWFIVAGDPAHSHLIRTARQVNDSKPRWVLARFEEILTSCVIAFAQSTTVKPAQINSALEQMGATPLKQGARLYDLLLRPQLDFGALASVLPALSQRLDAVEPLRRDEIVEAAEIKIKYSGYIEREAMIADRIGRLDRVTLRGKFDYSTLHQISTEARQKLERIDPETVGQASRIPGISPSDINILLLLLGR